MKKLTRTLVVVASLSILLVIAGVAVLPGIVALNRVKADIAATLSHATGRSITIRKLTLTLYPWLGIHLRGATIGNAPGFGQAPLAHVKDAVIEVRFLPLFRRRIVLRRIVLTGLALHLRVNKAGRENWAGLAGQRPAAAPDHAAARPAAKAPAFTLLRVAGITIKNASIDYRDARTATDAALTHLTVRSGAIRPHQPIVVTVAGRLRAGGRVPIAFHIKTRVRRTDNGAALDPFRLSIATLHAVGVIHVERGPNAFVVRGHLRVPSFAPRPLLAALGLHYRPRDSRALHAAAGDITFRLTPQRLQLAPLRLKIDDTTITGSILRTGHPPLFQINLALGDLVPADYFPAPAPAPTQAPPAVVGRGSAPAPFHLSLRGTITIASLTVHGLMLTHVAATLDSRDGRVRLRPLTANLYGGTLTGALTADTGSSPLVWRSQARLHQVRAGALLRALGLFPELSGRLDATAALHGSGVALPAVERSLTGRLSGSLRHGVLRGLDLDAIARNPTAAMGSRRANRVQGTAFSDLHASATIDHGAMAMQRLTVHAARLVASGHGTVILPTRTIDYLINVTLPSGLIIPVRAQGPVGHVQVSVSLNRLLKNSGHNGLRPALKHLRGHLEQLLGIH
ncbi:MAG TPA: AsmA family protein [Acidiferrobacter sp.]|nr:AsmA family protein [Acidiferrobacter sp.]